MQSIDRSVAYILNHYPKVSHTFIRREILELERRGFRIVRFAMRGWKDQLVDPDDLAEVNRTSFVLRAGATGLACACAMIFIRSPRRFASAAWLAATMMRGSDRLAIWHLIYLAEACWITRQIKKHQIGHLHAHFGTNPAEVALLVAVLANVSYSFTVHGPEEFDKVHSIHLAKKVERAAFVVAISSFCRSQIYRVIAHQLWSKVKVVHCGVDDAFGGVNRLEVPRSNRLVCVGRLCEQKGQLLLIEAVRDLAGDGRDFKVVLVGDGELRPELEAMIARYNLERYVEITGWASAERVKREIFSAQAVVLPSFAEGLPLALIEAMAVGRPVITTFVNGIPELVVDGKTGWLFPAGSKSDIVTAIRSCLDAPRELLEEMARNGRERVLQRHDLSRQAELLAGLFSSELGVCGDNTRSGRRAVGSSADEQQVCQTG